MVNKTKVLVNGNCPHCNKDVLIEIESYVPVVRSILKEEDIHEAKENAILEIKKLYGENKLSKEKYDDATKWLNDANTVFCPTDVSSVVNNIINSN